jgi:hypothetical protein
VHRAQLARERGLLEHLALAGSGIGAWLATISTSWSLGANTA